MTAPTDLQAQEIGTHVELDVPDPYAREAQTFPVLSEDMAERVASGVGEGSAVIQAAHAFLHPPIE
jgi:hypothetical protein